MIQTLKDGLEAIERGEVHGFEYTADAVTGHPQAAIYRVRAWICRFTGAKQFQFKLCHNGMEGSGFYGTREQIAKIIACGPHLPKEGGSFRIMGATE